jgi:hypothetical protein
VIHTVKVSAAIVMSLPNKRLGGPYYRFTCTIKVVAGMIERRRCRPPTRTGEFQVRKPWPIVRPGVKLVSDRDVAGPFTPPYAWSFRKFYLPKTVSVSAVQALWPDGVSYFSSSG